MRKPALILVFVVIFSGNAFAQDSSNQKNEAKTSSYNGPVLDPQVLLGAGGSISKGRGTSSKNGTFNFGFGVMLIRPVKNYKHLHIIGFGRRYDLFDGYFEPAVSEHDVVYTSINTFIPVKFGPITFEYSWGKIESLRRDRGRVFMVDINTDIFDDFKRLVKEGKIRVQ